MVGVLESNASWPGPANEALDFSSNAASRQSASSNQQKSSATSSFISSGLYPGNTLASQDSRIMTSSFSRNVHFTLYIDSDNI
jgi:hypothetical protein